MYTHVVRPLLFRLSPDPETAHAAALSTLERFQRIPVLTRAVRARQLVVSPRLTQTICGIDFTNPVGLAAGMDKNGRCLLAWQALGFGYIEMGTVTSQPQAGNERPRMMRIPPSLALRNWLGFNNDGANQVAVRLPDRMRGLAVPLGINIGKSKVTPISDAGADYVMSLERLHPFATYFVINVSSPNTQGLRKLAAKDALRELLIDVREKLLLMTPGGQPQDATPVFLKVSPDMTDAELDDVCDVWEEVWIGVDMPGGIIATNTTTSREGLTLVVPEQGGTSGLPLHDKALRVIRHIRRRLPKMPIIGVGGIFDGESAFRMFRAGATLVQILTGLVYEGPDLPRRINEELLAIMDRHRIDHINAIYAATL